MKTLCFLVNFTLAFCCVQGAAPVIESKAFAVSPADAIPRGYESYEDRPDILEVKAKAHPELGGAWASIKRAQIESVAMLLEMYPDREIYFLARDSEMLYDVARWVTQGDPAASRRLHLLNISRANMNAPHVMDYLSQEGISADALKAGRRVLFVDTGFAGTIPRVLNGRFPVPLRKNLQTLLMSSSNLDHPSSRVFLSALNPEAAHLDPSAMHSSIIAYEHLPRYTNRSDRFAFIRGRWQPVSPVASVDPEEVASKPQARAMMEDLVAGIQGKDSQDLLRQRRATWRALRNLSETGNANRVKAELQKILAANPGDPAAEAITRDYLDMAEKGFLPKPIRISSVALGLSVISEGRSNNKNFLIQKYPDWAPVLQDPQTQIPRLIKKGDFAKLGAIADSVFDYEFSRILAVSIAQAKPTPMLRDFVESLIKGGNEFIAENLAANAFTQPGALFYHDQIRELIETGKPKVLAALVKSYFSQPASAQAEDLMALLIQRSNNVALLSEMNSNTFMKPPWNETRFDYLRKAALLPSEEERAAYFAKRMPAPKDPSAPALPAKKPSGTKAISTDLEPGDVIRTASGRKLTVVDYIDTGKRAVVFRVKDSNGREFALKIARDSSPETLKSLADEAGKARAYAKYGVLHAAVVESQPTYVLKDWVNGMRADEWVASWEENGPPSPRSAKVVKLRGLIDKLARQGVYIGDLNRKNLIWSGGDWVIVDSGGVKEGYAPDKAWEQYIEKISGRWTKELPCFFGALQSLLSGEKP